MLFFCTRKKRQTSLGILDIENNETKMLKIEKIIYQCSKLGERNG